MLRKKVIWIGLLGILGYGVIPSIWVRMKRLIFKKTNGHTLYLTFDDGPDHFYTPQLLDLLKKYQVKATFFVVGRFALENHDLIKRIQQEGHLIGFHSYEHKNALWKAPSYMKKDFDKGIEVMKDLGINVRYYRPPWGLISWMTLVQLHRYRLRLIIWHVMAEDWRKKNTSQMIKVKLIERTRANDIICLHDGRGKNRAPIHTIEAIKDVIPLWISKGYKFETIDRYTSSNKSSSLRI